MPRTELLTLLHVLHTVSDALAHHITAKSGNDNIAPCARCIRRIDDVLQHGFSRGTMQNFRQLRLHACPLARCQNNCYKIQHYAPPVLRKHLFGIFHIFFILTFDDGSTRLFFLFLNGAKQCLF